MYRIMYQDTYLMVKKCTGSALHSTHRVVLVILPPNSILVLAVPDPLRSQSVVGISDVTLSRKAS